MEEVKNIPQVGVPKNPEPGQPKNSEINISESPSDKTIGRIFEQEERERLERKLLQFVFKVENCINLEPGEKLIWETRFFAKMTPDEEKELFDKNKKKYTYDLRGDLYYDLDKMRESYLFNSEMNRFSGMMTAKTDDEEATGTINRMLRAANTNYQRAIFNVTVSRTIKKRKDGSDIYFPNIQICDDDSPVFTKGGVGVGVDEVATHIADYLKRE